MKPLTAILALLLAVPPLPASECCCAELARRSAAAHDAAGAVEAPTAGGCPRCAGRKRQQNYPDGISHHCDCEAEFLAIDEGVISPRLVTSEPETNGWYPTAGEIDFTRQDITRWELLVRPPPSTRPSLQSLYCRWLA